MPRLAPRLAGPGSAGRLVYALVLAVGCSSSSGAPSGTATDAGRDARSGTADGSATRDAKGDASAADASGADAGESCSQCPNHAGSGAICVVSADAQLIDATGAPIVGEAVLLCGTNLCSLPVNSDAKGNVHFALCLNMTSPALKFLGDTSYVSFATRMTQGTETFPPVTLVPLPKDGSPFPTGAGSVTSGSVTLDVAASAVTFDPTQPSDASSHELRAAAVDPAKAPGLDPSLGVKALWGLAPANAILSPAATLTIPNPDVADWPAGTQVDVVLNSLDESPTAPVPYGQWGTVGTATVSADGTTIVTDTAAGDGLPLTGIVGVAPHK